MGQCPQLPPQLELPFCLSFRRLTIMQTTIAKSAREIKMVERFVPNHVNISTDSFQEFCFYLCGNIDVGS
jgi:hypothetical protein